VFAISGKNVTVENMDAFCWGSGSFGKIGLETEVNVLQPQFLPLSVPYHKRFRKILHGEATDEKQPTIEYKSLVQQGYKGVTAIAAGKYHSLFVSEGNVLTSGKNTNGVLGMPP
jgi:alpha-tubulin suppressor-like RCC1 family protein